MERLVKNYLTLAVSIVEVGGQHGAAAVKFTRERILEAANRLFYDDGVRAAGTEKIMALAEVAKATFYRHFESKDGLVLTYLDHRDRSFWEYLLSPAPPGRYS